MSKKKEFVKLLPSIKENEKTKDVVESIKNDQQHERIIFESLNKGIYDIDFTIGILEKILYTCDKHKTDPSYNLSLTLSHSIKQLLSFLKIQKCGVDRDPYQDMFCVNCGAKEKVFKGDVDKWKKCKKCDPKKVFN